MYKIDKRGGVQKSFSRTDPINRLKTFPSLWILESHKKSNVKNKYQIGNPTPPIPILLLTFDGKFWNKTNIM